MVQGRVVDDEGTPVAGARILFSLAPVAVADIAQLTAADGGFVLAAPAAGRYRVSAHAAGHVSAERDVDVGATAPPALEIVLRRTSC